MNKPAAALAAVSLIGGLIALTPTPAQAAACDSAEVIVGTGARPEVAVGTTKNQSLPLIMATDDSCRVTGASVIIESRHSLTKVTLHRIEGAKTPTGTVAWAGSATIAPRSLHNSDAGDWNLVYLATGPDSQAVIGEAQVRRATRLSFNAGPEPVRNDMLTYSGRLERANWDKHRYDGYRQQVAITYEAWDVDGPTQDPEKVTELTTAKDGTYRYTEQYRGPGLYNADFAGTTTSGASRSPFDRLNH